MNRQERLPLTCYKISRHAAEKDISLFDIESADRISSGAIGCPEPEGIQIYLQHLLQGANEVVQLFIEQNKSLQAKWSGGASGST
jgi:hypothetical protein